MTVASNFCNFFGRTANRFEVFSSYSPHALNLKYLIEFGIYIHFYNVKLRFPINSQNLGHHAPPRKSFEFLKFELPTRLANIMQEIKLLPQSLLNTTSVHEVLSKYERSFEDLIMYEDGDSSKESVISSFSETIRTILHRHSNVVESMAKGILELKSVYGISPADENQLQYFLDRFYVNRIGSRVLINQHLYPLAIP
ncbi:unnamed protein product [Protopolystoma xenopodis]|uniref:Protein-serine/threonine kinase n=1 Tax=Protopolystoma xenopodis TaxID=117903 RepID=A0A3S5CFF0_9PLAT|nr:unnamed protein product [Protopolystoma xenopodis]